MSATATGLFDHYLSRADWLLGRQNSIGASEAAAIVGLSGYQSAYSLWFHKTEPVRIEPMDELQESGLRLEPVIAKWFSDLTGIPEA